MSNKTSIETALYHYMHKQYHYPQKKGFITASDLYKEISSQPKNKISQKLRELTESELESLLEKLTRTDFKRFQLSRSNMPLFNSPTFYAIIIPDSNKPKRDPLKPFRKLYPNSYK